MKMHYPPLPELSSEKKRRLRQRQAADMASSEEETELPSVRGAQDGQDGGWKDARVHHGATENHGDHARWGPPDISWFINHYNSQ